MSDGVLHHTSLSPGQDKPAGGSWHVVWAKAGDHASSAAEGSGVTIGIRYRILNARLAAGAVSAGHGGGLGQAYDGWRVVSQFEFQQWGG